MKKQKLFSSFFHVAMLLALAPASDVVVEQNMKDLVRPDARSEQKSNVDEITKPQIKFERVREPRI